MTALTLIDGEAQRCFTEHPMETARRALLDAAELEGDERWATRCRRLAAVLPHRAAEWERQTERKRWQEENREADAAWRRISVPDREGLVLRVLGDDRLTIPDLVVRMNAELGYSGVRDDGSKDPLAVYITHVRRLVTRMYRAGQLDRVPEPAPGCKIRHRYFRPDDEEGGA